MYKRYSKSGCPSEFPVRSKCIALFQKIHGVDVILFGMYVFEYDHDCPAPNKRRVYISYLDSAQYLEPACYRTATYHALLVEYLRYVKERGFHTAHIWSCPPTPGDDYIFHCHPSKQLIPRDDMLRTWYMDMLEKAKNEGIVLEVRTLHDEYFKNSGTESTTGQASEPTCLPYFEGDYIPGEIENIINEISSEDEAKNKNRDDLPSLSSSNKGGSKKGTRSNPGELVNVGQDKVMLRLGLAMTNMQQNFMVVYLRSRAFAAAVERGDDVSGWTEQDDEPLGSKRMKIGGKNSGMMFASMQPLKPSAAELTTEDPDEAGAANKDEKPDKSVSSEFGGDQGNQVQEDDVAVENKDDKPADDDVNSLCSVEVSVMGGADASVKEMDDDPMSTFNESEATITADDLHPISLHDIENEPLGDSGEKPADVKQANPDGGKLAFNPEESNEKTAVDEPIKPDSEEQDKPANKRGFDDMEPAIAAFAAANANTTLIADTNDEDEPQETEMFESRQQFLNYCQANHFQFDDLRRAKHTTMMMLFQLHHPNAPKFIPQCAACYREITHGTRNHCIDCTNYDLCEDCYEPVITGKWADRDSKYRHDSTHTFASIDAETDVDVQKNREERSRTIKAHLELLAHAASCEGPPSCTLNNCPRMKKLFEHVSTCKETPKKNCKICSRILTLLTVHARSCNVRDGSCPLPYCDRIREKMHRRRQQQQLMDDRRRQAQNQLYREASQQD
jgi:hypothetical protein